MDDLDYIKLKSELDRIRIVKWVARNPPMVRASAFEAGLAAGEDFQFAYAHYIFGQWLPTQSDAGQLRRLAELLNWDLLAFFRIICNAK